MFAADASLGQHDVVVVGEAVPVAIGQGRAQGRVVAQRNLQIENVVGEIEIGAPVRVNDLGTGDHAGDGKRGCRDGIGIRLPDIEAVLLDKPGVGGVGQATG